MLKNVCTPAPPYGIYHKEGSLNIYMPSHVKEDMTLVQLGAPSKPAKLTETGFNPPLGWMIQSAGTRLGTRVSAMYVCVNECQGQWRRCPWSAACGEMTH